MWNLKLHMLCTNITYKKNLLVRWNSSSFEDHGWIRLVRWNSSSFEDHGWISFYDGEASLGNRQKKWGPMDRWVGCEYLHRPRQICTALVGGAYGLHGAGACRRRLALVLPIGDPLHILQLRRGTRTAGTFSRRPQPPTRKTTCIMIPHHNNNNDFSFYRCAISTTTNPNYRPKYHPMRQIKSIDK